MQTVSKIKTLQTDKTLSFGSDALGQHGATDGAGTVDALTRLIQSLRPTP